MVKNSQPKLDLEIFLDRTHGKAMAAMLRRVGITVKTIYQVYPKKKHQSIKDPQWIAKCGEKGWIAISGDKRIEKNVENKQAVIDAKCKLFLLTDTNSLPEEWAAAIILGRDKISNVARKNDGPFLATISKRSDSHVTNARFPIPRSPESQTVPAGGPVAKVVVSEPLSVVELKEDNLRLPFDERKEDYELETDPTHSTTVQGSDSGRAQGEAAAAQGETKKET